MRNRRIIPVLAALACMLQAQVWANQASDAASVEIKSMGQAAIYGKDIPAARDRAIADAQRKAVEQAVGTMVSAITVTENFQLISDKILTQSHGYVRAYQVLEEGHEDGVFSVKISAKVSTKTLQSDLDGVLAILNAKNMPRVLLMISEQNIGQGDANFWWGPKSHAVRMDVVENVFVDTWSQKGISFVDRQSLQGTLSVGDAVSSAEPSNAQIKTFAGKSGAEVVVIGKAMAIDSGTIMGTQMHSLRANISLRALNLDNGEILATVTASQAVGHIDATSGGNSALRKVAQKGSAKLLDKLLSRWKKEITGPSTITLVLSGARRSKDIRRISGILRSEVRGVQNVRQRSFSKGTAHLEVAMVGSAQTLAEALEEKSFSGLSLNIVEITANTVAAEISAP